MVFFLVDKQGEMTCGKDKTATLKCRQRYRLTSEYDGSLGVRCEVRALSLL
jgi:hypothetical protein